MSDTLTPYTPEHGARLAGHMYKLAKVLSGEMEGKGRSVKKLSIAKGNPCATDGETVWLSYPIVDGVESDALNMIMTEAVLAHEAAGHLRYTNFNAWKRVSDKIKKGTEDRLLHDIVNIVEDARVNHLLGQDFAGSKKRLDFSQNMITQQKKMELQSRAVEAHEQAMFGVIAIATEIILGEPHFINDVKVTAMMNEARPYFAEALKSADTSQAIKGARVILAVYRKHFPEDETMGEEYGAPQSSEGEGLFADDMNMDNITEAANNQRRNGKAAEKVKKTRMKNVKVPEGDHDPADDLPKGLGDDSEGSDAQGSGDGEGGESSDEAGAGQSGEGDEVGESGESGAGEGDGSGEGSEAGEGSGEGDASEGSEGEGNGDSTSSTGPVDQMDNSHAGEEGVSAPVSEDLISGAMGSRYNTTDLGTADVNLLTETSALLEEITSEDYSSDDSSSSELNSDFKIGTAEKMGHGIHNDHAIMVKRGLNREWLEQSTSEDYNRVSTKHNAGIKKLSRTIQTLVKGTDSRFFTHKKKGGLDTRRLWAHTSSERVFRTKKPAPLFNTNVVVLIDASGSMGRGQGRGNGLADQAAQAAVVISQALEQVGATYEVVDFSSSYGNCGNARRGGTSMNIRKAAHEPLNKKTKGLIATANYGGENSDGFAIRWAIERTQNMGDSGAKKIVFVISDGAPSGPAPEGIHAGQHLTNVLFEAESEDVIIFSVGIGGMDTSEWYGNHGWSTIPNNSDIPSHIITPLKVALKKAV